MEENRAGESPASPDPFQTRPSPFGRIKDDQPATREIAWREFYHRYMPIIRGFARNLGVRSQDAEDVVQDVMAGFFGAEASFTYDPARGRFRGYLKTATLNAIRARLRKRPLPVVGLDSVNADRLGDSDSGQKAMDDAWDAEWDRQILNQAMEQVRGDYQDNSTFRCFEQYAILGHPATEVAAKLQLSIDSVYQAKARVTESLRRCVAKLEALEL